MKKLDIQKQLIASINRHFIAIAAVILVLFVVAQFVVLATVGTRGAEIAEARSEKEVLRVENDYLRAEIDRAKTLAKIEEGLDEVFTLEPRGIETVQAVGNEVVGSTF